VMHGLEQMLNELESHQLHVVLVPLNPRLRNYNEGGCKRVCADKSPRWYAFFCSQNPSSRGVRRGGFDTRIKRRNTLRALRQLLSGQPAGKYSDQLLSIASKQKAA
jgi:hypothetical protein